ncbi:MAG: asparagine synthetase B family protein [Armatimonadota bacterium]
MNDIFGIVDWRRPVDRERLDCLLGPDGAGDPPQRYFSPCGTAALAARRIPGPTRGSGMAQSPDGRLVVVADSRLDERAELYAELRNGEIPLERDAADSELILAAYARWGERCPERLYGDFAFAVWDTRERRLFVARDAMGIRLLCYSPREQGFAFATSADALLRLPETSRDLDACALSDYLTQNSKFDARTFYIGVQNVVPGHSLSLAQQTRSARRYWDPGLSTHPAPERNQSELVEEFATVLRDSVEQRLSDLDGVAGVFTSGGLDSTSIAALAQRLYLARRVRVRPIALNKTLGERSGVDERVLATSLAASVGMEYVPLATDRFPVIAGPGRASTEADRAPVANDLLVREALLQLQSRGGQAAFTGHGGDTLFLPGPLSLSDWSASLKDPGVRKWLTSSRGRNWAGVRLRGLVRPWIPDSWMRSWRWWSRSGTYRPVPRWLHPELVRLTRPDLRRRGIRYARRYSHPARQHQYQNLIARHGQRDALSRYSKLAREARLDMRFPLMDRRLAEFALRLPFGLLVQPGTSKWILRETMKGILPEEIRIRRKYNSDMCVLARIAVSEGIGQYRALLDKGILQELALIEARVMRASIEHLARLNVYQMVQFLYAVQLEIWLRDREGSYGALRSHELDTWQREQANEDLREAHGR